MDKNSKCNVPANIWEQFRTSEHWAVSLARDILWLVAVVGGIALALYILCGTWPAVVTIESTSMVPHMNVGDLVVVVEDNRFGDLQTWEDGKTTGYTKFGDYGDVIIYRPNGVQDFWSTIGVLPLSKQHPVIHRAMTWVDGGQPEPLFINPGRGQATPLAYTPVTDTNESMVTGSGYIRYLNTTTPHGGYITKGDNNLASDQGYLAIAGVGTIEPVEKEWVVGKSLFVIPLIGLLPLHIWEVIIVMIIAMVLYEWYLNRRETEKATPEKKGKKPGKKGKK
jgi:signal peptidase